MVGACNTSPTTCYCANPQSTGQCGSNYHYNQCTPP
jgi:hypothetical protein